MTDHETWRDGLAETTVTVDGHDLSMAFHEAGDPADPTVVFLHGIPTWSFLWRDVAPPLSEAFHVLVPDLPGYGDSARHDGFDRSIRAGEAAVDALLADRGVGSFSAVAHDVGGGVALRLAAHQPDRVAQLVVSNAVCYDSWPVGFVSDLGLPETADRDPAELEPDLDFAFGEGLFGDADEHAEFVAGMKAPWLREDGPRALARAAVATNTNHTTEIPYGEVTAETLCLWGADDVLQPLAYGERLAADVAGDAEVVALDDAYHWVVEDRTAAYREALRSFLG